MANMIDIAGYAYAAGLRSPVKIAMAVAIAEAESGGNPRAYNGKGRDNSYGLWQINMLAHTTSQLGISSAEALYDPVTNAKAMVIISHSGATWKPWSTYPLRAAAYLPAAQVATTAYLADPSKAAAYVSDTATAVADATGTGALAQGFTQAAQTPLRVMNWLTEPGTWVRISLFVLGGAMVIAGVAIFAKPAAESAASTALKVLPVGKVGKIVGAASKGAS